MQAIAVVVVVDVSTDFTRRVVEGLEGLEGVIVHTFGFKGGEERFHHGIVCTRSRPSYAHRQTMVFETVLVRLAVVVAAVVGMQDWPFTVERSFDVDSVDNSL